MDGSAPRQMRRQHQPTAAATSGGAEWPNARRLSRSGRRLLTNARDTRWISPSSARQRGKIGCRCAATAMAAGGPDAGPLGHERGTDGETGWRDGMGRKYADFRAVLRTYTVV